MNRLRILSPHGTRWTLACLFLAITMGIQYGPLFSIPFGLAAIVLLLFFYDSDRELPSHPLGVMSPVDGRIVKIDLFNDPFLDRTAKRITIQADLLRVYHARSPTEGKLMEYWPVLPRDKQGYDKDSVKAVWWIQTDEKDDVVLVVESDSILGGTHCEVQAGERIGQARRCGRFPLFCRIDLLVDEKSFVEVEEGQQVLAGIHTIATFNHDVSGSESGAGQA